MSLRTVALETPRLWRSTNVFDPIGSLVATKSATMARKTSKRRSSALPICDSPPDCCPFYGDQLRRYALSALPSGILRSMIFKGVREGKPYPDHGLSHR